MSRLRRLQRHRQARNRRIMWLMQDIVGLAAVFALFLGVPLLVADIFY